MRKIILLSLCLAAVSCATTIDVENRVKDSGAGGLQRGEGGQETGGFPPPAGVEIFERPVFVPAAEAPPARPPAGEQAVRASNAAGIVRPEAYSHAAMVYDYHPDLVYEVYAQPLRVCDVSLQPGERAVEPPFVSDSERWILGAGISYDNGTPVQHIYVKPVSHGLEASLIINTDMRVYHIILRSFRETHMPIVRWRYLQGLPRNYAAPPRAEAASGEPGAPAGIDPRFLSFNYRIRYGIFSRPSWLPELVFDDGGKTYVTFPDLVLQRELPAIFENRNDVLNYRVMGNVVIIDKLIENITVRIGRTEITITKKRRPSNG